MKMNYNREEDILTVETGEGDIDHAEEMGPFIVHFDGHDKPVLIEIMDASQFLASATQVSIQAKSLEIPSHL